MKNKNIIVWVLVLVLNLALGLINYKLALKRAEAQPYDCTWMKLESCSGYQCEPDCGNNYTLDSVETTNDAGGIRRTGICFRDD